jgi:hypothetical protein
MEAPMRTFSRDPDPTAQDPWPFRSCPDCEQSDFMAESMSGRIVFTCLSCGSAWRWCLGYLVSVSTARTDELTT